MFRDAPFVAIQLPLRFDMKKITGSLTAVISDPFFVAISGASSVLSALWYLNGGVSNKGVGTIFILIATVSLLVVGYIYSINVRMQNLVLQRVFEEYQEINRIYRDGLQLVLKPSASCSSIDLIEQEEASLRAVCQRIQAIFDRLIGRRCTVTIKLVTESEGSLFAHTYVRSQDLSPRDIPNRRKYIVGVGKNTAFDASLEPRTFELPSHFFGADLRLLQKRGLYLNEREGYHRFYKSTLVVPIRNSDESEVVMSVDSDLIGFLAVDTLSVNRLNDDFHLHLLSALGSQMYNFIRIMRAPLVAS